MAYAVPGARYTGSSKTNFVGTEASSEVNILSIFTPFFAIFGLNCFSARTNLEGLSSPVTVLI